MNFLKCFLVLSCLLVPAGCSSSSSTLEGTVIASRAIKGGLTEHLVETENPNTPYYILRVNHHNVRQGSKIRLELYPGSETMATD